MCSTSTLAQIDHQALDKYRISLTERFLDPFELLTRYKTFHVNAEALLQDSKSSPEYQIHHIRAREFREVLQILDGDLDNG